MLPLFLDTYFEITNIALLFFRLAHPSMQTSLSVADRISELEKQQRFSYLDPDKRRKIPDPTLKAIQKKALLSFYERHHNNPGKSNVWHSEPQLAQSQQQLSPAPQPPPRIKVHFPSRRASSAADYASANNSKRSSLASTRESKTTESKLAPKHQHSNSCGSLSADLLGPVIIGPSISIDEYIPEQPPERPPKHPHLRAAYPDLFQNQRVPSPDLPPPSPPTVTEDEVFNNDEPLPPPPPELENSDWQQEFHDRLKENASTRYQFAAPQVEKSSKSNHLNSECKEKMESPIKETVSALERNSNRYASVRSSIRARPPSSEIHPMNKILGDKPKHPEHLSFPNQRTHVENSSTRYPSTHKLVLNGNIAVSQKVTNGMAEQYRAEPLNFHPNAKRDDKNGCAKQDERKSVSGKYRAEPVRTQHPSPSEENRTSGMETGRKEEPSPTSVDGNGGFRASIAESPGREMPPPLQPRQMRINQSMRARISETRPGNLIRTSPSKERSREPKPLAYTM